MYRPDSSLTIVGGWKHWLPLKTTVTAGTPSKRCPLVANGDQIVIQTVSDIYVLRVKL